MTDPAIHLFIEPPSIALPVLFKFIMKFLNSIEFYVGNVYLQIFLNKRIDRVTKEQRDLSFLIFTREI